MKLKKILAEIVTSASAGSNLIPSLFLRRIIRRPLSYKELYGLINFKEKK